MEKVVVLGGCRTPFAKAFTDFEGLSAVDLGAIAVRGLLKRVPVQTDQVDEVIWGTVCPPPGVYNVAREIALRALTSRTPGVTVSQACISSARAVTSAFDILAASPEKIIVAGGSESASNVPVSFPERLVKRMYTRRYSRSKFRKLMAALSWHPGDYFPKIPPYYEPSTGLTIGQYGERVARLFGVSREDQDKWAVRSHQKASGPLAAAALLDGTDIEPVEIPGKKARQVSNDNCIRADTTVEKLAPLPAAFEFNGTLTTGNSAKAADGACALMLTSERNARRLGLNPVCALRAYYYTALPLDDEMLLGPALSIPGLCFQTGVSFRDIDFIEMHEAFAAQVIANLRALASKEFLDRHNQILAGQIEIDEERINVAGGSIAVGHAFGATGGRLVLQCMRRLSQNGGGLGIATSPAAGGLGVALLLESIER